MTEALAEGASLDKRITRELVLDGGAAIVRLTRPRALNALDGKLLDELEAALDDLARLSDLRVVILTGTDKCFSVGADLKEELLDRAERIGRMHRLVVRIAAFPAITIAAIEGWALGGGLELAMACTFRAAATGAKLGLPEIKLGVIPSYGGTQLSPRLIGESRALELLCLGEPIEVAKAEQIGLVNWVANEQGGALALALDKAVVLAGRSAPALRASKAAVHGGIDLPLEQGLALEAATSAKLLAGDAPPDAASAFRERNTGTR